MGFGVPGTVSILRKTFNRGPQGFRLRRHLKVPIDSHRSATGISARGLVSTRLPFKSLTASAVEVAYSLTDLRRAGHDPGLPAGVRAPTLRRFTAFEEIAISHDLSPGVLQSTL